jgi:hypothetical protein
MRLMTTTGFPYPARRQVRSTLLCTLDTALAVRRAVVAISLLYGAETATGCWISQLLRRVASAQLAALPCTLRSVPRPVQRSVPLCGGRLSSCSTEIQQLSRARMELTNTVLHLLNRLPVRPLAGGRSLVCYGPISGCILWMLLKVL